MTERAILEAVARADLWICAALPWAAVLAAVALALWMIKRMW